MISRECSFCTIATGERTAEIVFNDPHVLVLPDQYRQPAHGGHFLLVPREHAQNRWDMDDEVYRSFTHLEREIAQALIGWYGRTGVFSWASNGSGQSIPHYHCHMMPHHTKFWDFIRFFIRVDLCRRKPDDHKLAEMAQHLRTRIDALKKENVVIAKNTPKRAR